MALNRDEFVLLDLNPLVRAEEMFLLPKENIFTVLDRFLPCNTDDRDNLETDGSDASDQSIKNVDLYHSESDSINDKKPGCELFVYLKSQLPDIFKMFDEYGKPSKGSTGTTVTKRPRGRPPKFKPRLPKVKSGRKLLWMQLLKWLNNTANKEILIWRDPQNGIFEFLNKKKVCELWQNCYPRDNRRHMTYDKMTRALRYHYKDGIMKRVGKKNYYQFLPEAIQRWEEENRKHQKF